MFFSNTSPVDPRNNKEALRRPMPVRSLFEEAFESRRSTVDEAVRNAALHLELFLAETERVTDATRGVMWGQYNNLIGKLADVHSEHDPDTQVVRDENLNVVPITAAPSYVEPIEQPAATGPVADAQARLEAIYREAA